MNNDTIWQVQDILTKKWYRKSQTLGEDGWAKIHSSGVDWTTTMSKFHEEYIYRPGIEKWDYPTVEEDRIIDELIPQIDNHLGHFHLDI